MSTTERDLTTCTPHEGHGISVISPREVPLGGPRAMTVRRLLPHKERSFVGAWCFVDHYGPDDVSESGGMDVPPHPHTGLQTVSWLFEGEVEHRDSGGVHAPVRAGECNLMTAGRGIAHSEVSTPGTVVLHGVQLWVVLPKADSEMVRGFQHYAPTPVTDGGVELSVFIGDVGGQRSPVRTQTPLLGAQIDLQPNAVCDLFVDAGFEHGVLVDQGHVTLDDRVVGAGMLGYRPPGSDLLRVANTGDAPARVVLLGGEPFDEEIIMWWNFIGRSTEEIRGFREEWQAESDRFGRVEGYEGRVTRLPAPELPAVTLRPRGRR